MMSITKRLFVTVGTTQFDTLIQEITSEKALETLAKLSFTHVNLQIGKGKYEPATSDSTSDKPLVSYYRLKDSTQEDIRQADLVISHAGAGSIMDSLSAGKAVLVVINEELMGNHQTELAAKLAKEGHLHYCGVTSLVTSLHTLNFDSLQPFPPGEPNKFAEYLDRTLGFT